MPGSLLNLVEKGGTVVQPVGAQPGELLLNLPALCFEPVAVGNGLVQLVHQAQLLAVRADLFLQGCMEMVVKYVIALSLVSFYLLRAVDRNLIGVDIEQPAVDIF